MRSSKRVDTFHHVSLRLEAPLCSSGQRGRLGPENLLSTIESTFKPFLVCRETVFIFPMEYFSFSIPCIRCMATQLRSNILRASSFRARRGCCHSLAHLPRHMNSRTRKPCATTPECQGGSSTREHGHVRPASHHSWYLSIRHELDLSFNCAILQIVMIPVSSASFGVIGPRARLVYTQGQRWLQPDPLTHRYLRRDAVPHLEFACHIFEISRREIREW